MFGRTPKYVAKQVRGSYVLQRRDAKALTAGAVSAAGGIIVIVYGITRRDVRGALIAMLGAAAAIVTAHALELLPRPIRAAANHPKARAAGPSYPRELESTAARQQPTDKVDEALMESFPASDPSGR